MSRVLMAMGLMGCVPATVDTTPDDYLNQRDSPDSLINEEGIYNGGWYRNFDGIINPEVSQARASAFKGWLHFNLGNQEYSITGHLADLHTAGNAAISVVNLSSGETWTASTREAFSDNQMVIADDFSSVVNDNDGSYLRLNDDGTVLEFDIQANDLRVAGSLASTGADRFIQVTRYHDGYGILQWFEQVQVLEAAVTFADGTILDLPAGMRGTTDRMAGHRRTHQHWNWIAGSGNATRQSDGETVEVAMSMSKDREGARPQVDAKKYAIWIDGVLTKVPSLNFDYSVIDEATRETTEWVIESDEADVNRVDLLFEPKSMRRDEAGYLWFYYTDYIPYIGSLTGSITVDGEQYVLEPMTVIAEDARLTL